MAAIGVAALGVSGKTPSAGADTLSLETLVQLGSRARPWGVERKRGIA